jgi:hypothetical protein
MKDMKAINKAIGQISATGKKLDALIQETAVDVLEHFQTHRDTGLVNRLFLALPKGTRGIALGQWLLRFVAVKVNTNAETKKEQPFVFDAGKVAAMLDGETLTRAGCVMWYDLKPEKALDEVFDVQTAFKAMLRHIERSAKVEHFNYEALKVMAKAVGISESDVPTKPGLKAKTTDPVKAEEKPTEDVLATTPAASL